MRVCDWIAEFLYERGVTYVHGLMGGGAAGLNDGFIKNGKIKYVCYHHEQGAGHAAIGESKITGSKSHNWLCRNQLCHQCAECLAGFRTCVISFR